MKLRYAVLAAGAASLMLAGCFAGPLARDPGTTQPRQSPTTQPGNDAFSPAPAPKTTYTAQEWEADVARRKKAAPGLNAFGFKIFGDLVASGPSQNTALSPTSLGRAILMAYFGSRGATRDELAAALGIPDQSTESVRDFVTASGPSLDSKGVKLQVSDSAWVKAGFEIFPQFLAEIGDAMGAVAKSFADPADGEEKIGEWIVQASNGLLDGKGFKIDPQHMLVLVDVIAFDGRWASVFDSKDTTQRSFHVSSAETVQVPMMRQYGKFAFAESDGYQVVNLPYQNSVYSMYVLMPSDSAQPLDGTLFEKLIKAAYGHQGELRLPKFSIKTKSELTERLKASGLARSFSDAADFGGISPTALKLSACTQQVRVAVDETGTVAAAATELMMEPVSMPPTFQMEVNRPFYFAIRDNSTGTLHFLGKVVKPE